MMKIVNAVLNILRWYVALICLLYCLFADFNSGTVLLLTASVLMLPLRWICALWKKVYLGNRYIKFGLLTLMILVGMIIQSNQILADMPVIMEPTTETTVAETTIPAVTITRKTLVTTKDMTTAAMMPMTETVTTTTATTTVSSETTVTKTTIASSTAAITTTGSTTPKGKTTTTAETKTPVEKTTTKKVITTTEAQEKQDTMVWITKSGSKYHSHNSCGKTDAKNARQIPLSEAQKRYEPCSKCY